MDKQLFRVEEAAEQLAVSRSMLYELIRSGAIRSIHIGRSRRIPRKALDDFLAAREQCSSS